MFDKGALSRPAFRNLGRSQVIPPGSSEILVQTECDDDSATVISVTLVRDYGNVDVILPGGPVVGWPYCEVDFGSSGTSAMVELDFIHGLTLSVPGSFIRVRGVLPPDAGAPMKLGAFLTYLPIGGKRTLTRSYRVATLGVGAESPPIVVPPFADTISFQRTPAQAYDIRFYDRNGNLLYTTGFVFGEPGRPIPIAAASAYVTIFNASFNAFDGIAIFGVDV